MSAPIFSIVMPTFNSAAYVEEAIESVLAQTVACWELLVVDDDSSDGTPAIIERYAKNERRVRPFLLPINLGPAGARNVAIEASVGRYVAFLDSDDIWRRNKLERQLQAFHDSGAPITYSAYEKVDEGGARVGRVIEVPERIGYKGLLGATVIATVTAAYDVTLVGRVQMPEIRKRQDLALWLKILRRGGEAYGVNEPLAYLRKRPGSLSSNKVSAAKYVWRVYRDLERLSFVERCYYFSLYASRAFVKSVK